MKKLTAVEWLVEKMLNQDWYTYKSLEYIEQAKELEKQQIVEALHYFGIENAQDYYNKTFNQTES